MYLVMADRDTLLNAVPKGGRAAELGVYTGDHAETMLRVLQCDELHLVDYWRYLPGEHNPFPDTPTHFSQLSGITEQYMGPDPDATLERCFQHVERHFADEPRVTIHRMRTSEAVGSFDDASLDLIYVDANHQYEYVMRDLLEYAPKLVPGGLMILNDFYDAEDGRQQNLGIVGAASAFCKRTGFEYVALGAGPWSDLVITNDLNSSNCRRFVDTLLQAPVNIVELPNSIVPSYTHKTVALSSGALRSLPAF